MLQQISCLDQEDYIISGPFSALTLKMQLLSQQVIDFQLILTFTIPLVNVKSRMIKAYHFHTRMSTLLFGIICLKQASPQPQYTHISLINWWQWSFSEDPFLFTFICLLIKSAPVVIHHLLCDRLCGFEPFFDDRGDQYMFKRILNCEYEFVSPWWDNVSLNAKDLVSHSDTGIKNKNMQ